MPMSTTPFPTARRTLQAGTVLLIVVGIAMCVRSAPMASRADNLMARLGRTGQTPAPARPRQDAAESDVLLAGSSTPATAPAVTSARKTMQPANRTPGSAAAPEAQEAVRVAGRVRHDGAARIPLGTRHEAPVRREPVRDNVPLVAPAETARSQSVPPPRDPHEMLPPAAPQTARVPVPPADRTALVTPRRGIVFRPVTVAETPAQRSLAAAEDHSVQLAGQLDRLQRAVDRLAQAQLSQQTIRLEDATRMLQQLQESTRMQDMQRQIQELQDRRPHNRRRTTQSEPEPAAATAPAEPSTAADQADTTEPAATDAADAQRTSSGSRQPPVASPKQQPVLRVQPDRGSETFSLQIQDAEITQVLEMLGQMAGLNILAGRGVTGTVSANLQNVTVNQALEGILRSLGLAFERDGDFIFVMTPAEQALRRQLGRKLVTKIYQPNYVSVRELQALVTPLLTEGAGKLAVTSPSGVGIASDPQQAGGDNLSQTDALMVQDYPEVISEIDRVVQEMDIPPLQVVIEAMILSVRLNDEMQYGVNFALLNKGRDNLLVSGNGATLNASSGFPGGNPSIIPPGASFLADAAGLKYGFIAGDVTGFLQALESISDTSLIASPQLRVLNKQKAELIIGDRLSYKTLAINGTTTVENVNFMDSGTKLLLRPFISPDGMVRIEVHPERSSAVIDPDTQLPNQQTTEVTTNIMVRDGSTVVIGGLIEEQATDAQSRVPLLGSLPVVGAAFRNREETTIRTELIVLITPRIVRVPDPQVEAEGEAIRYEQRMRTDYFRNHLSAVNRRNLARMHYERAFRHFQAGELDRAAQHIEEALRHSPNDTDALRLRERILTARHQRRSRFLRWPGRGASSPDTAPATSN